MADNTAATFAHTGPAYIESGIVLDVDIESYSLTVHTQFSRKPIYGVSFAVPYHHSENGEGIYFMPEVGSTCWIAFPSDGMRPFVLAWTPMRDSVTGSLKSNRANLNPGDIYLGTRDENFLILRRGGVVQVGGGPLSQRMYIPLNNVIKDFCENYQLHTLAGDLEWTVLRDETSTDGMRPSILRLAAREYADDAKPIALLEIGSSEAPNPPIDSSHTSNSSNILSLTINASGDEGAERKISLSFRKDGSSVWRFNGDVSVTTVDSSFVLVAEDTLDLTGTKHTNLTGGDVEITADDPTSGTMKMKSQKQMELTAVAGPMTLAAPNISIAASGGPVSIGTTGLTVAGGATQVVLASASLINYLLKHTHNVVALGAPTSFPLVNGIPDPNFVNPAQRDWVSKKMKGK